MDFLSDNFISYDNDFTVKQEKATGPNIPLDSFFNIDPAFSFAEPIPQTLKNLLENDDQDFTLDPSGFDNWARERKRHQPFNIIKTKKEDTRLCSPESFEVKIESDDKLVSRTKRILKREKAKQRIKIKQEGNLSVAVACADSTTASEVVNNPDLDDKTKKKMIQMIRNRISAQSSRDRKKVYMVQLEDAKSLLMDENSKLNFEKEVLLKELRKLEETQKKLIDENEGLKRNKAQNNGLAYQFSKDGDSNSDDVTEDDSEGEEFSNMFKTIVGSGFGKMTGSNKKFYKSTLALATMISVVMMLNIAKQGGAIVQDGAAAWIKNSNLSGIQKKLLQNEELAEDLQELTEEISSSKQWDFFDRLKPLLQNLEAERRKLSFDTQGDGTTGTPASPPNMIKMEELVQEDLLAEPECLLPALDSKMGSIFGEERMSVENFRHSSGIKIVGMNTVRYFGAKNLIKFTQQNDPTDYLVKREGQKDDLFVKDEWYQGLRGPNAVNFNS